MAWGWGGHWSLKVNLSFKHDSMGAEVFVMINLYDWHHGSEHNPSQSLILEKNCFLILNIFFTFLNKVVNGVFFIFYSIYFLLRSPVIQQSQLSICTRAAFLPGFRFEPGLQLYLALALLTMPSDMLDSSLPDPLTNFPFILFLEPWCPWSSHEYHV